MLILDLISLPESKTLEFKEKMPESLAIAKTACAFANGGGGTILIGVVDKEKTITGINEQEIHALEEKIANIVYKQNKRCGQRSYSVQGFAERKGVNKYER